MRKKKLTEKETEEKFKSTDPYAGAVLEEVREQMKIIVEGNNAIEKQLGDFQIETRKNFQDFQTETRENFQTVFEKLSAHDEDTANKRDLVALDRRVTRLEEKTA